MSKKKKDQVEAVVKFSDEKSKDVFMSVLDEYSSSLTQVMNALSPTKGYGNADAKVDVRGDEIIVSLNDKDKGSVLTIDGFMSHKDLTEGVKYVVVKDGKPAVFKKSTSDKADLMLGYASDMAVIVSELNKKDADLSSIIEASDGKK